MSSTTLTATREAVESTENTPVLPAYFGWKGLVDRLVAAVLLVPGLPMIGLLIVLVRTTSKGPGIFAQERTGRDGEPFTMYKLRSMRVDAESSSGAVWSGKNDPRITPIGGMLRKLHLDELPQLFNVLRGEMSLIGPRPERPEFVSVLAEQIDDYEDRLTVLPGVTGLAQINLPPDTDLNSVRRKQTLDVEYIQTASCSMDLRILLCTLLRVVGIRGEVAMRSMRLERHVVLPELEIDADDSAPEEADEDLTPDLLNDANSVLRETLTWSDDDTAETPRLELEEELQQLARQDSVSEASVSDDQTDRSASPTHSQAEATNADCSQPHKPR